VYIHTSLLLLTTYRFIRIRPLKGNAAALAVARTIAAPVEKSDSHAGKKGRDNSKIQVAQRPAGFDAAVAANTGPSFYDSSVGRDSKKKTPLKTPLIEGMHSPERETADAAAAASGSGSGSAAGGSSKSGTKRALSPGASPVAPAKDNK
jgi:hypothetical protein